MLNLRDGGRKTKQRWTVIKSLCFLKSGFLRARIQVRESDIPPAKSSRTITHKFPSSLQCLKCTLYLIPFFRPSYPSLHCSFYTSLLRFCHSSFPCTLRASLISSKLRNTLRCHMQLCPAILHLHSQSRDWTMAQENTSRPLAAEVRVHFQANSYQWWTKRQWDWFLSEYSSLVTTLPLKLHTHSLIYHRRCIIVAINSPLKWTP